MGLSKKKFDYELVERAAREHQSKERFCAAVGIAPTSFYHFRNSDPYFAAALNRGRGLTDGDPRLAQLTAEDFHQFGKQRLRPLQIAQAAGTNVIGINQHFKRFPALRAAYDKGQRGIALVEDLSIVSEMKAQNDHETDFEKDIVSRNSASLLLHAKITEALESGEGRTIHQLAEITAAGPMSVYTGLSQMIAEKSIEKYYRDGGTALYRLKKTKAKTAVSEPIESVPKKERSADEQRVFRAISEGNNLSRSICMATGIPVGVVMTILDRAEGEEIVARREPNFIAYFLAGNAPEPGDRLILSGKGTVEIIRAAGGSGSQPEMLVSPKCGLCGDEMIAQHFEEKVVSWYCSDCWEKWDKDLVAEAEKT